MEKAKTKLLLLNSTLLIVIALAFSSATLWMIESEIKYTLFIFEAALIVTLYLIINSYNFRILLRGITVPHMNLGLVIDLLLMGSSLILLFYNSLSLGEGLTRLLLAWLCTSFLFGYALLNLLGVLQYLSRLETIVLSNATSFTATGSIAFLLLLVTQQVRPLIVIAVFLVVGLLSAARHISQPRRFCKKFLCKPIVG